jgi:hypothetical protein
MKNPTRQRQRSRTKKNVQQAGSQADKDASTALVTEMQAVVANTRGGT